MLPRLPGEREATYQRRVARAKIDEFLADEGEKRALVKRAADRVLQDEIGKKLAGGGKTPEGAQRRKAR